MKTIGQNFWIVALAAFAMLIPQNAYAVSAAAEQVTGEVLIAKAAAPETWTPITAKTALESGDSIKTKSGSCTIVYADQASFAMQANTTLILEDRADAKDLRLLLGKINGKVNHQNATQPFVVTTPAAVATVRGTEVDFGFNSDGQLTVDLHNGKIQVVNEDADLNLDLEGGKSITIKYDLVTNSISVANSCGSDGAVSFSMSGSTYTAGPCEKKEISLSTAEVETQVPGNTADGPDDDESGKQEHPDAGRRATDSLS